MTRFAVGLALATVLGAGACKKNGPPAAAIVTGSDEGSAAGSGVQRPSGSAAAPGVAMTDAGSGAAAAAPFDASAALDAALKTEGVPDKAVKKRVAGTHSAWALVVSKTRDNSYVMEYTVMRASAEGVAEMRIPALARGKYPALDDDVDTFEVRDLDGDGHDECLTVITWHADFEFPYKKGCKRCEYGTGEGGKQLYVIHNNDGALAVAFEHLVEYTTLSQPSTAEDPDPPPQEKIAYDWKVDGKPPMVTLTRTEYQLNKDRPKQLLDPANDDRFAAGSGETVPLVLK